MIWSDDWLFWWILKFDFLCVLVKVMISLIKQACLQTSVLTHQNLRLFVYFQFLYGHNRIHQVWGGNLWHSLVYNNIQRREILICFSANLFSNTLMHTNPYLTTPPQTVVPSIFSSTFLVLIFTTETHRHCQCHFSELSSWKFLQFGEYLYKTKTLRDHQYKYHLGPNNPFHQFAFYV